MAADNALLTRTRWRHAQGRARRSTVEAEAARRSRERKARLGGQIRSIRLHRGWTQADLADRAGLGRQVVGRAERGIGPIDLETLERISITLDVPLVFDFGRDRAREVSDAGHLAMQELLLQLGRTAALEPHFELATKPAEPWRSSDVAFANERYRVLIGVECWNDIGDVGASSRSSTRKQAELEALAVARWGLQGRASHIWVVRATARNRDLVARYPEVFAGRFPGSSRAWVEALTTGADPPREPGLVWCDVGATRLFEWRQRQEAAY
jgi:transcriptional regulator with XRE-family HTH domain